MPNADVVKKKTSGNIILEITEDRKIEKAMH